MHQVMTRSLPSKQVLPDGRTESTRARSRATDGFSAITNCTMRVYRKRTRSCCAAYSRRVHKWTRLEGSSGEGRCPPLVREVNSRTSPHLRPSPWLGLPRTVQSMDSSSIQQLDSPPGCPADTFAP